MAGKYTPGGGFGSSPYVPSGMPGYGTKGGGQRPKTPAVIINEQAQANVGTIQQYTANQTPTVSSPFIAPNTPVRQGAYEDQAMAALQNLSVGDQQKQQQEHATTQQGSAQGHQMSLAGRQQAAEAALQRGAFGQESQMFGKRVAANDARLENVWGKIQSLPPIDGGLPSQDPSDTAAHNAILARKKDELGLAGRGAVNSLTNLMSTSGLSGGGYEQKGLADIVGGTQTQFGESIRDQAIQDQGRLNQVSDRNYAGNLQRRGQDMARQQAIMQLLNIGGMY